MLTAECYRTHVYSGAGRIDYSLPPVLHTERDVLTIVFTVVYIPPDTDAKSAMCQLWMMITLMITRLQNEHLLAIALVAGDFNHTSHRESCQVSISISMCRPGRTGHSITSLLPRKGHTGHIRQSKLKNEKPIRRTIPQRSTDASEWLRGCFACTKLGIFL